MMGWCWWPETRHGAIRVAWHRGAGDRHHCHPLVWHLHWHRCWVASREGCNGHGASGVVHGLAIHSLALGRHCIVAWHGHTPCLALVVASRVHGGRLCCTATPNRLLGSADGRSFSNPSHGYSLNPNVRRQLPLRKVPRIGETMAALPRFSYQVS
jgi:hypothetical protein